jgi:SAM-dependent methyltransferase
MLALTNVKETAARIPKSCKDEKPIVLALPAEWKHKYPWATMCKVPWPLETDALKIADSISLAIERRQSSKEIEEMFDYLNSIRVPQPIDGNGAAFWDRVARHMPEFVTEEERSFLSDVVTNECRGLVLEAMSGYETCIKPRNDLTVMALDYSKEALKRYSVVNRERILLDLNSGAIHEIPENYFDSISLSLGFKFLSDPIETSRQFLRILKPGGKLLILDSQHRGYAHAAKRSFSGEVCMQTLRMARFEIINIKRFDEQANNDLKEFEFIIAEK